MKEKKNSKMKLIKLSFVKLKDLLLKYNYTLETIFCEGELIRFLECSSPIYQKSFFIFIPDDRYALRNTSSGIKKHDITLSTSIPSQTHIEYMSTMKGPSLECDLITLTGNDLFLYFDNGTYKYYHITHSKKNPRHELGIHSLHDILKGSSMLGGLDSSKEKSSGKESLEEDLENSSDEDILIDKEDLSDKRSLSEEDESASEEEDESILEEEEDESILDDEEEDESIFDEEKEDEKSFKVEEEKSIKQESKDTDIIEFKKEDSVKKETSLHPSSLKEEESSKKSTPPIQEEVEIIFENEKGELIDDVKLFLEKKGNVDSESLNKIKSKLKKIEEPIISEHRYGSTIPPHLEEIEVSLGIVIVCLPIASFFKNISSYEDELLELYHQLDENETEMREQKLSDIQKMCAKFVENTRLVIEKKTKKEMKIKNEIFKLTGMIAEIKILRLKTEKDPIKFKEDIKNLDNISEEVKSSIHSLNSDLLKIKDEIHEYLSNYTLLLKEGLKI
jgi:hypothetical protein